MLRSRHQGTAAQQNRVDTAPPAALLVVVLSLALIGVAYGLWRGHWTAAALHAVIVAITGWGLQAPRRRVPDSKRSPADQELAVSSSGTPLSSARQGTTTLTSPEPGLPEIALGTATPAPAPASAPASASASASASLPIVDRLAITGRLRGGDSSTTGCLSLVLPADINVTVASVIDVLLTAGHRILDDYRLTDHPLPEVDVTAVDRTEAPSTSTPVTGFTVRITNTSAARRSDITVDAHRLPIPENGPLLIATTLLAGAEYLLNDQDYSFHPFTSHK